MSQYDELQKAAAYAAQDVAKFADEDEESRALQQFHEEVDPETVLALIAENEELGRYLCTCRDCGGEGALHTGDWHSYGHMEPPEPVMEKCGECDGTGLLGEIQDLYQVITERDQLRAEVAGLKTGYEAYERVNAELKAENETLVAAAKALRDEWRKDQVDAKRHRFARDCAYGALTLMEGKRVFVELDYPEGEFSGCDQAYDTAIDAALGQGEQS